MILPKYQSWVLFSMALLGMSCASVNEHATARLPFKSRAGQKASPPSSTTDRVTPVSHAEITPDLSGTSDPASGEAAAATTEVTGNATATGSEKSEDQTAGEPVPTIPAPRSHTASPLYDPVNPASVMDPVASSLVPPPAPADDVIKFSPAHVEETDHSLPINLASALKLADARPLVIAAAQASAWVAEAQLQRAQVLWVPQFTIGAVYYRHDGYGPDFNRGVNNPAYGGPTPGGPLNQNLNWFYGNGSFYQSVNITDAYFAPLAARQNLDAQRLDIQAAKNDVLQQTADAYFDIHRYRGQYAGALDVIHRGEELVKRIESLSEDLIPEIEVNRVRQLLADMVRRAATSREMWRVSSANLTQILRLDPTAVVVPVEPDHLQITLIDPSRSLDELIAIGVTHRPEIAANKSLIKAAEYRVRQEKNRPFLPLVMLTGFQGPGGMYSQFGVFGTGSGGSLNQWSARDDVSLQLIWQLEGLGFGNLARIKEQRGNQSDAIVQLFKNQDKVSREVTAAQARVQSSAARAIQTERELREAIISYEGNYTGLAETSRFHDVLNELFRPQEAIRALQELLDSYERYFTTIAEYNKAQFDLYHAIGYPAREVTSTQSLGDEMDVSGARPFDLPMVVDGPPAATQ